MFTFHNSGHKEFMNLILLLFCFAQRPSFPCDTQKRESVLTRLKVVVRASYRAYFVVHVFKYLAPIFFPGDLHDTAL